MLVLYLDSTICITTKKQRNTQQMPWTWYEIALLCLAQGSKATWKLALKTQTSCTAFSQCIKRLRCRGGKRCCFHLWLCVGSQKNRETVEKWNQSPGEAAILWRSPATWAHTSVPERQLQLCALWMVGRNVKIFHFWSAAPCLASTPIITSGHGVWIQVWFRVSQKFAEIRILQFKILRVSLPGMWSLLTQTEVLCFQCWWWLNYICLQLMPQTHRKSTNAPHIKVKMLR